MPLVLTVSPEPRRRRVHVTLDDGRTYAVHEDAAAKAGVHAGREISEAELEALLGASALRSCLDAASRFLKVRPRSEAELKQRLVRLKHAPEVVDQAVARLREENLVSDATFAGFWTENREAFNPRSKRLVESELIRKGVSRPVIEQMTQGIDDDSSAYDAATKKLRTLSGLDFETFRRRLGAYLQRRGFDYEVTRRAVKRLWEESQGKGG